MKEWLDLLRHLGDAVLDLAAAEAAALAEDLRRGGRQAARVLVLLAIAAVLAVVAWALFTLALVWGLATAIGLWQAALVVGAVYAVIAIACAFTARRRFRSIEPPLECPPTAHPGRAVGGHSSGRGGDGSPRGRPAMTVERTTDRGTTDAESHLVATRREVEERLDALRVAARERVGVRLEKRAWTLPLVAAAVGFSFALWLRGRSRARRTLS